MITSYAALRGGTAAIALSLAAVLGVTTIPVAAQQAPPTKSTEPVLDATGHPLTQSEIEKQGLERLTKLKGRKINEWTAEELVEVVGLTYFGGRWRLAKVANSGREEGTISLVTPDGEQTGEYTKRYVNGATTNKDRVRLDLILATSPRPEQQLRYTIAYNGASVWTAQNNAYLQPDAAAGAAFRASVTNDYTSIFRYQEDGATLKRLGAKKMTGLDTEGVELARADGSKVRFYISTKTYKVLHVEYDLALGEGQAPVTFRESYFDWRVMQQTLVPGVRKLRMNDQLVQTLTLGSATYAVTLDDSVFLQI